MEQVSALDLEASPVQGQIASAVLDCNGTFLRGQLAPVDASLLFQMLVDAGSVLQQQNSTATHGEFRRLTVTCRTVRYVVARDDNHVYIVQTRAGG
jgi:hypothetical protein